MTVSRYYLMIAREGEIDALCKALIGLAEQVRALPGCDGVEIGQEDKVTTRFHFVERWTSVDAHREGGKLLPKDGTAPLRAVIAEPPYGAYLNPVS